MYAQNDPKVFVSIVSYNSAAYIQRCLQALLAQTGFTPGRSLLITVVDNASGDGTPDIIEQTFAAQVTLHRSRINLGFCAANNLAAADFLRSDADYFMLLNADLRLDTQALQHLITAIRTKPCYGSACPRLLRADDQLEAVQPLRLDAAGMILTPSLRHFDRGSEQPAENSFTGDEEVFGGSGACLLMKRDFVKAVLLTGSREADLQAIYPEIPSAGEERAQLLDEAFFAYREDADLAWRGQNLGWKCIYAAKALGYHRRTVLPELRSSLAPFLNLCGVRNRFLLQINNYSLFRFPAAFIPGVLLRNLVVLAAVLLVERSSIPAFRQIYQLLPRALERRGLLKQRIQEKAHAL
jgi:GT2 family glycosyltransferase